MYSILDRLKTSSRLRRRAQNNSPQHDIGAYKEEAPSAPSPKEIREKVPNIDTSRCATARGGRRRRTRQVGNARGAAGPKMGEKDGDHYNELND